MRRIALLSVMILWALSMAAQSTLVGGAVHDAEGQPVPYAHVQWQHTTLGTVSNLDGAFALARPATGADSLRVHCIGFAEQVVAVHPDSSACNIVLRPLIYELSELAIQSVPAQQYLQTALEKTTALLPSEATLHHSYYKETVKENSRYVQFGESYLDFYVPSHTQAGGKNKKLARKLYMVQSRVSEEGAESGVHYHQSPYLSIANATVSVPINNANYRYEFAPLQPRGMVVIEVVPTDSNAPRVHFTVAVNAQTGIIDRIESGIADAALAAASDRFTRKQAGFSTQLIHYKTTLRLAENDGGYYLKYLANEQTERIVVDSTASVYNVQRNAELLCTELQTAAKMPKRSRLIDRADDLYAFAHQYDVDFWARSSRLQATEAEQAIRADLEHSKPLEQQFFHGNRP